MFRKKIFSKFYKLIKIFIFSLLYKKIDKIIKAKEVKEIVIKEIIFDSSISYNFYKIPNGRIYSTTIHDTAFIKGKSLIKEPSFQYRYDKNDRIFNSSAEANIVLNNGTPNFLKKIDGSVFSLLCGGAGKNNYWHWIFDVLPKIGILEKLNLEKQPDFFLLPSLSRNYQKESLDSLGILSKKLLDGENFKHLTSNNILTVDHPNVFNNNASESITNMPMWIIDWLRKNFINDNNTDTQFFKKIYIDRNKEKNNQHRKIINSEEVSELLKSFGYESITLSEYTFQDQVKIFKNADNIVGLHGAGFANIVFSKPGTRLLEIQSLTAGNACANLAKKCKLRYQNIIEKNISPILKHQNSQLIVNLSNLKKKIQ
jgi:capsular polysaccharide biosynthesis protein